MDTQARNRIVLVKSIPITIKNPSKLHEMFRTIAFTILTPGKSRNIAVVLCMGFRLLIIRRPLCSLLRIPLNWKLEFSRIRKANLIQNKN